MADLVPAVLLTYGLVSAGKPEWIAAIDRHGRAAGTPELARDIEMSDRYYTMLRVTGLALAVFGIVFLAWSV